MADTKHLDDEAIDLAYIDEIKRAFATAVARIAGNQNRNSVIHQALNAVEISEYVRVALRRARDLDT
jgi:hypothetical protein